MTVKELRELLDTLPEGMEVFIDDDGSMLAVKGAEITDFDRWESGSVHVCYMPEVAPDDDEVRFKGVLIG